MVKRAASQAKTPFQQHLEDLVFKDKAAAEQAGVPEYITVDKQQYYYSVNRHITENQNSAPALQQEELGRHIAMLGARLWEAAVSLERIALVLAAKGVQELPDMAQEIYDKLVNIGGNIDIVSIYQEANWLLYVPPEAPSLQRHLKQDMNDVLQSSYSELIGVLADTDALLQRAELKTPQKDSTQADLKSACEALKADIVGKSGSDMRSLYLQALEEKFLTQAQEKQRRRG